MNTNIEVLRELDELVEAARLLGATQAKKLFGEHTDEDSRFERAMYESIDKHRAALLDWEAKQPAADQFIATFRCENNGIVGTTDAKVHSVTRHDDGRIEVVIDHWPKQPAADCTCPHQDAREPDHDVACPARLAQQPAAVEGFDEWYDSVDVRFWDNRDACNAAFHAGKRAAPSAPVGAEGFDEWFDEYTKNNYTDEMLAEAAWKAALAKQPAAGDGAVCPNCERLTEIRHCQACGCDFIIAQHQEPKP